MLPNGTQHEGFIDAAQELRLNRREIAQIAHTKVPCLARHPVRTTNDSSIL